MAYSLFTERNEIFFFLYKHASQSEKSVSCLENHERVITFRVCIFFFQTPFFPHPLGLFFFSFLPLFFFLSNAIQTGKNPIQVGLINVTIFRQSCPLSVKENPLNNNNDKIERSRKRKRKRKHICERIIIRRCQMLFSPYRFRVS